MAPAVVGNLAAGSATNHSVTLTWTAPGDDNNDAGTAATAYDIRYSTSAINEGNWASATLVTCEAMTWTRNDNPDPRPGPGRGRHQPVLDGRLLDNNTPYYFGIKTIDDAGLASLTTVSGTTLVDNPIPGP